ncbi:hypothetical protein C7S18_01435 [Ahniella affigens]|uniref:Uncharacterized protein n=1 Tax=Ahniella affigens TaxID=2021234 RepID=A0A2P1PM71_9GAMM|nr:hypothetical protein C7S18_01435 [Ahniella affigens]
MVQKYAAQHASKPYNLACLAKLPLTFVLIAIGGSTVANAWDSTWTPARFPVPPIRADGRVDLSDLSCATQFARLLPLAMRNSRWLQERRDSPEMERRFQNMSWHPPELTWDASPWLRLEGAELERDLRFLAAPRFSLRDADCQYQDGEIRLVFIALMTSPGLGTGHSFLLEANTGVVTAVQQTRLCWTSCL